MREWVSLLFPDTKIKRNILLLLVFALLVVFCLMILNEEKLYQRVVTPPNLLSYDELSDLMYLKPSENPENELLIPLNPLQNNNNVSNILGCREKSRAYIFEEGEVVPIFIISYNRYRALHMTISSIQRLTAPIQLYIIDFHSTHDSMIKYLEFLSHQKNIFVINIKENLGLENLSRIGNITQNILSKLKANYYIVTDPDVVLASSPDLIQYYITVLEACPQMGGIGCGLSISDLPTSQMSLRIYNYQKQFWRNFSSLTWKGVLTQFYYAPIDTTFLMNRRSHTYRRLIPNTVRTDSPYLCRHSPFYANLNKLTEDEIDYATDPDAKNVSHFRIKESKLVNTTKNNSALNKYEFF